MSDFVALTEESFQELRRQVEMLRSELHQLQHDDHRTSDSRHSSGPRQFLGITTKKTGEQYPTSGNVFWVQRITPTFPLSPGSQTRTDDAWESEGLFLACMTSSNNWIPEGTYVLIEKLSDRWFILSWVPNDEPVRWARIVSLNSFPHCQIYNCTPVTGCGGSATGEPAITVTAPDWDTNDIGNDIPYHLDVNGEFVTLWEKGPEADADFDMCQVCVDDFGTHTEEQEGCYDSTAVINWNEAGWTKLRKSGGEVYVHPMVSPHWDGGNGNKRLYGLQSNDVPGDNFWEGKTFLELSGGIRAAGQSGWSNPDEDSQGSPLWFGHLQAMSAIAGPGNYVSFLAGHLDTKPLWLAFTDLMHDKSGHQLPPAGAPLTVLRSVESATERLAEIGFGRYCGLNGTWKIKHNGASIDVELQDGNIHAISGGFTILDGAAVTVEVPSCRTNDQNIEAANPLDEGYDPCNPPSGS